MTVSMTDISVLHSAKVVYFCHKSCFPILHQFARLLNTSFSEWRQIHHEAFYKDMQKTRQSARVSVVASTITLPNGQHLSKDGYHKRTGLYPNTDPSLPFQQGYQLTTRLISQLRSEPCDNCGCTVFLGDSPCSNQTKLFESISPT